MATLKNKVLAALRWTVLLRLSSQVITWGITIVVMRLLDPEDYGVMAMAEVAFGILMILSSAGFGSAIVQSPEISEVQLRQVFGVLLVIGSALFLGQFLLSPAVAYYFQEPAVEPVSRVLAFGFLIVPFATIPASLLGRDIDFKRKAAVDLVASVASALFILILAASGLGIWALVYGRLLQLLLRAVGWNIVRPFLKLPIFSFESSHTLLRFGGILTATTILWFAYNQLGVVVAGRFLSAEAVGYYAVAMHLASIAVMKIMPLLNEVALPAYSKLQEDPPAVGYYVLKVIRVITLFSFPIFAGLSLVAPEFTKAVLGLKYVSAILPLILLSLLMPLRIVGRMFPAAVYALGRPEVELVNTLTALVIMLGTFLVGVQWGVVGLCVSWLVGYPVVLLIQIVRSGRLMSVTPVDVLAAVTPATVLAALMSAVVLVVKYFVSPHLSLVPQLAVQIATGAAVYPTLAWLLYRDRVIEAFRTIRRTD